MGKQCWDLGNARRARKFVVFAPKLFTMFFTRFLTFRLPSLASFPSKNQKQLRPPS
jgi:hypothetical protein